MLARALVALAVPAACLAGGAQARLPGPPASAQLKLMPLPYEAFGAVAPGLKLDADESGVVDNAKAADDSTTKADSAASLEKAGRITGYALTFDNYGLIGKRGSVVYVSTELGLYQNAQAASKGLKTELADASTPDAANGLRILATHRFDAPGLGDEAAGLEVKAKIGAAVVWFTGVATRRKDLLEFVALLRNDDTSERASAVKLAHALAARVEGVLGGKVTTPPVNLPSPSAKPAVKPRVKIDAGALTSADLHGAKVKRAEYVNDPDAVSAYEREFDEVNYGKTRLLSAENDVSLYESAAAAKLFIDSVSGFFNPANPSFKSFVTNAFSQGSGFKVKTISVLRHGAITAPDAKGTELVLRVGTPLGPVEVAYAFFANGRLTSALLATSSFGSSIHAGDLQRLENLAAARLQAAKQKLGERATNRPVQPPP